MLINLVLQLLAVAPHAVEEIAAAVQEIRSNDPNGTKATNIAANVSNLATQLGSAIGTASTTKVT